MSKAVTASREAGLFLDPEMNIRSVSDVQVTPRKRVPKVARTDRPGKEKTRLVDAIIEGERVKLAVDPNPLERGIEIMIRTAVAAAGIMCMKHRVEICPCCGAKPKRGQGLGLGCADLICVVPPYGRFLAIEVKRPKTRAAARDEQQRKWMSVVRRYGGVAGVATNVDEAFALLNEARRLPGWGVP